MAAPTGAPARFALDLQAYNFLLFICRSFKFEPFRDISLSLGCIVGARASDPAKRQPSGSGQDSGREQRSPKRRRVDSCAVAGGGTEGDGGIGDGGIDDADVSSLLLAVDEDVIDINDVPGRLL